MLKVYVDSVLSLSEPPPQPVMENTTDTQRSTTKRLGRLRRRTPDPRKRESAKKVELKKTPDLLLFAGRPFALLEEGMTVIVTVVVGPRERFALAGLKEQAAPAGSPEQENETVPVKPFMPLTVKPAETEEFAVVERVVDPPDG